MMDQKNLWNSRYKNYCLCIVQTSVILIKVLLNINLKINILDKNIRIVFSDLYTTTYRILGTIFGI